MENFSPERGLSREKVNKPNTLDLVRIDGRWAQYKGGKLIIWLDTGEGRAIDFENMELLKVHESTLQNMIELKGMDMPENEIENIRWGPEESKYKQLKKLVKVFGEYETKQ